MAEVLNRPLTFFPSYIIPLNWVTQWNLCQRLSKHICVLTKRFLLHEIQNAPTPPSVPRWSTTLRNVLSELPCSRRTRIARPLERTALKNVSLYEGAIPLTKPRIAQRGKNVHWFDNGFVFQFTDPMDFSLPPPTLCNPMCRSKALEDVEINHPSAERSPRS